MECNVLCVIDKLSLFISRYFRCVMDHVNNIMYRLYVMFVNGWFHSIENLFLSLFKLRGLPNVPSGMNEVHCIFTLITMKPSTPYRSCNLQRPKHLGLNFQRPPEPGTQLPETPRTWDSTSRDPRTRDSTSRDPQNLGLNLQRPPEPGTKPTDDLPDGDGLGEGRGGADARQVLGEDPEIDLLPNRKSSHHVALALAEFLVGYHPLSL